MKALFRCEKNWQKINVQRFSANFLFSKNGKCRSITYSGDFATLPDYFTASASRSNASCNVALGQAILIRSKPSPSLPKMAPLSSQSPAS